VLLLNKMAALQISPGRLSTSWAWTPTLEGDFTHLVSALMADGQRSISNAVIVRVISSPQMPAPSPSVSGIAIDPIQVAPLLGETQGGTPIAPPPVFIPEGSLKNAPSFPPKPAPVEPLQQPSENSIIPINSLLWIQNLTKGSTNVTLPGAPTMEGSNNRCGTTLLIEDNADNEMGFFLYRLDPGQPLFKRIATLDGKVEKNSFTFSDNSLMPGSYSYSTSAFNSAGEASREPITIQVSGQQCAATQDQAFDLKKIIITPSQSVEKMDCYGSGNGIRWVRLAAGRDAIVIPQKDKFDFSPYWKTIPLPCVIPPESIINFECWGWNGNDLSKLGGSKLTLFKAKNPYEPGFDLSGQREFDDTPPSPLKDPATPYNLRIGNTSCAISPAQYLLRNTSCAIPPAQYLLYIFNQGEERKVPGNKGG
jgi:hypothetical protein